MLEGFQNAGRIPELRRRLLFTFGMLAVYRLVVAIPTPGIDGKALAEFFDQVQNSVLGLVIFAGFTLFDFQRVRLNTDAASAPLLAASIFLDILNVFLFFLQIFTQDDR